jgi:hypothetical protein
MVMRSILYLSCGPDPLESRVGELDGTQHGAPLEVVAYWWTQTSVDCQTSSSTPLSAVANLIAQ